MTGRADHFVMGDWNAVCAQCGRKRKGSTLVKNWQGFYVCREHWEPRHQQDFVRAVPETVVPPWVQEMPAATMRQTCSPRGSTAYGDTAVADCARPDYISPLYDPAVS